MASTFSTAGGEASSNATAATTAGHYRSHADASSYENAYFYEPGAYTTALRDKVQRAMNLVSSSRPERVALRGTERQGSTDRVLLDVGGGTGNFTRLLLEGTTNVRAVVVDPFLAEDEPEVLISGCEYTSVSAPSSPPPLIRFVRAGAEDFISRPAGDEEEEGKPMPWWRTGYHQILMKEVVHHLKASDRAAVFRGLREGLAPLDDAESRGGDEPRNADGANNLTATASTPSLLIITRPQRDIDYPLWEEARRVWADQQPSLEEMVRDLGEAGFARVTTGLHSYPCSIALDRWKSMVRRRFWSTFSHFGDDELELATDRMEVTEQHRIDDNGVLHFDDRLLFITAHCRSIDDGN
jgi:SAM-dependent methyltransferase